MTAQEILDRFDARLRAHPQLRTLAVMVGPYRALMGDPASVVATLDVLVNEYAQARGLKIEAEDQAA